MSLGEYIPNANTKLLLHLNGNSNDASGNGNNCTAVNITYSLANGRYSQGAGFNGTTSAIYTGSAINYSSQIITISCWINFKTLGTGDYILFESSVDYNSNNDCYVCYISNKVIYIGLRGSVVGTEYNLYSFSPTIANNTWYYFTFILDKTKTIQKPYLYINGSSVTGTGVITSEQTTNRSFATQKLYIGQRLTNVAPIIKNTG